MPDMSSKKSGLHHAHKKDPATTYLRRSVVRWLMVGSSLFSASLFIKFVRSPLRRSDKEGESALVLPSSAHQLLPPIRADPRGDHALLLPLVSSCHLAHKP